MTYFGHLFGHLQAILEDMYFLSPAISRPIVPPFATGSARVVGNVEASGGENGNV
jgi:hypothetical protein